MDPEKEFDAPPTETEEARARIASGEQPVFEGDVRPEGGNSVTMEELAKEWGVRRHYYPGISMPSFSSMSYQLAWTIGLEMHPGMVSKEDVLNAIMAYSAIRDENEVKYWVIARDMFDYAAAKGYIEESPIKGYMPRGIRIEPPRFPFIRKVIRRIRSLFGR